MQEFVWWDEFFRVYPTSLKNYCSYLDMEHRCAVVFQKSRTSDSATTGYCEDKNTNGGDGGDEEMEEEGAKDRIRDAGE